MSKMLILRGLPGSGKSTHAKTLTKHGNWVRINRDLIREMLHFNKWSYNNEKATMSTQKAIVRRMLAMGLNVIIDDTNLTQRHVDLWKGLANEIQKISVETKWINTSLSECLERNAIRGMNGSREVPENVIWSMAREIDYPKSHFPREIIVDMDGTMADIEHRRHFVTGEGKKDWHNFFEAMEFDTLRRDVWEMVKKDAKENNAEIIFVSGRPDNYRDHTTWWLHQVLDSEMDGSILFMRPASDSRPDTEIKQKILDKYFHKENIIRVYDDRPSVIRMWRSNGLDVIDVGDGEEF